MLDKFILGILSLFLSMQVVAQNSPLQNAIDQMPAKNARELNHLMDQFAGMGQVGIADLTDQLVGVGYGDDSKIRYALSGLAKYLGNHPVEQRQIFEGAFIDAINKQNDAEVQVFLLEQLQFFASEHSLPGLRPLIRTLCDPALATIAQIGGTEALALLISAYEDAGDYCKQSIVKVIGTFDDPIAISKIERIASSSDIVPKSISLPLLAKKGAASSLPLLQSYQKSNPAEGTSLLLTHAGIQASKGKPANLTSIAGPLLKSKGPDPNTRKAIQLLAQHGGASGKKLLLKALKKNEPALGGTIISALSSGPNVPLPALFKSFKKLGAKDKVNLLTLATDQAYKAALPQAQNVLSDPDPMVVKSAIRAISTLDGKRSLPQLQSTLKSAKNPDVIKVTTSEISRWVDTSNMALLDDLFEQTTGVAKAGLITMIADRGLTSFWSKIRTALGSSDAAVRQSAFSALPKLSAGQPIGQLVTIAPQVQSDEERASLVTALVGEMKQMNDQDAAVSEVIRLIGGDPQIIQAVLPKIGGRKALAFINDKYGSQPDTREELILDWGDPEAIGILLAQGREKGLDPNQINTIFRLVNHQDLAAVQKLLYLREVMPLLSTAEDRRRLLRNLGNVRTPAAFNYVASFMSDEDLKETAAGVVLGIALPAAGEMQGLFGSQIVQGLMRADTILAQTDQEYTQAFLDNYLSTMPDGEGYLSLFNGVDLSGWKALIGNPISRDTMFGLERQTQQRAANAVLSDNWQVRDGAITFVGEGYDNLCTEKKYRDFEMQVDWRITKDGDSGIYLRGSPQVQIWDTSRTDVGAQVGSGGLYNNQVHTSKPLVVADNPVGEWNTFRIIMIEDKVTVYLNGILVTDKVVLENYWNRELPIFREEQIELQAHGTDLQFRDIYVREITGAPDISPIEQREGFISIFNGVNLDGWIGNKVDYVVENGEIVIYPSAGGGSGNLFTEKEYDNFRLRFEFKLTPGANNGLGIHAPLDGDAAYVGKELQILDNTAEKYANLKDYQYHGSIYGLVPARRGELKPVGEWNKQEVVVKGNIITVILNNQRILSANLDVATRNGTLDGKEHPGLLRTKGHIGFLGHGDQVHFRNIRLVEIKE